MSHSPLDSQGSSDQSQYLDGWNRLADLIRNGHSFSGRERNCAFINLGKREPNVGRFADASAAIGLDLTDDGRGMAVVDWDHDGDLDLWLANRTGPRVRLMRNDVCTDSSYVAFELRGKNCNRDGIGARVELATTDNQNQLRTVRAGEGFLSQSSKTIHFGLPANVGITEVRVRWPGSSTVQSFYDITANNRYQLVEGEASARPLPKRFNVSLRPQALKIPESRSSSSRIVLSQRPQWPSVNSSPPLASSGGELTLVTLWASWCKPCLEELVDLTKQQEDLSKAGVKVIALNCDEPRADAEAALLKLSLPFAVQFASSDLMESLTMIDHAVFYRKHPLPLPCSYLVDADEQITVIYKGRVDPQQVVLDAGAIKLRTTELMASGLPFAGRSVTNWFSPGRVNVARAYFESGYIEDAKRELLTELVRPSSSSAHERSLRLMLEIAEFEQDVDAQTKWLVELKALKPNELSLHLRQINVALKAGDMTAGRIQLDKLADSRRSHSGDLIRIAQMYGRIGDTPRAIEILNAVVAEEPKNVEASMSLAIAFQINGQNEEAVRAYRKIISIEPENAEAMNNLAWLLAEHSPAEAVGVARSACDLTNESIPAFLDTLAFTLEKSGQRDKARHILEKAVSIARGRNELELMRKMQDRLARLSN